MAFAGNPHQNGKTPFVTEKELIRQVASNITKETMILQKTKYIGGDGVDEDSSTCQSIKEYKLNNKTVFDSKRVMAENINKI